MVFQEGAAQGARGRRRRRPQAVPAGGAAGAQAARAGHAPARRPARRARLQRVARVAQSVSHYTLFLSVGLLLSFENVTNKVRNILLTFLYEKQRSSFLN